MDPLFLQIAFFAVQVCLIVVINGLVAVVAIIIAVAQQKFHRRVEDNLSKAIEKTKTDLNTQISSIKDMVEKKFETTEQGVNQHIEQRMWQMEKRFYQKMADPKTYGEFIKELSEWVQAKWMTQVKAIDKKVHKLKKEATEKLGGGGEDPFTNLLTGWDDEKGIVGNLISNPGATKGIINEINKPKEENQNGESGEGLRGASGPALPDSPPPVQGPPPEYLEEVGKIIEKHPEVKKEIDELGEKYGAPKEEV